MRDVILFADILFGIAVLVWGVCRIIQIRKQFKQKEKAIDEWYQSEMEWLEQHEEQKKRRK